MRLRFLGIGEKSGPPFAKTAKGRPPRKVLLSLCGTIYQWLLSPIHVRRKSQSRWVSHPPGPAPNGTATDEQEDVSLSCHRASIISALISLLSVVACSNKISQPKEAPIVPLCQIRDQPQQFLGRTVRTSGWIYTDLERFGLGDEKCALALGYEGRKDTGTASDMEQQRFEELLKAAKKGTFNTNSELFAVWKADSPQPRQAQILVASREPRTSCY